MTTSKVDQLFVGLHTSIAACRHVRIVCPHQLHAVEIHLLKLFEVGLPSIILAQIVVYDLGPENLAQRGVSRITGIWHQHLVARIAESESGMQNALLATDKRLNLSLRVEVYIIPTLIEICHSLSQFRNTYCRLIAVGSRQSCSFTKFVYGLL